METRSMRRKMLAVLAVAMLVMAGCGDDDDGGGEGNGAAADDVVDLVGPARSEAMLEDLVAAFADAEPDIEVALETVGGQAGMTEALDGNADVAFTPRNWLGEDTEADTDTLGRNLVVYAVAEGNPDGLTVEAFAPDSGTPTRICGTEGPFGDLVLTVLARTGVTADPETVETGCDAEALEQVASGELGAALMFRAGLEVPDGVELVEVDEEQNLVIEFVAVAPGGSDDAETFLSFLDSDEAQAVLEDAGYLP